MSSVTISTPVTRGRDAKWVGAVSFGTVLGLDVAARNVAGVARARPARIVPICTGSTTWLAKVYLAERQNLRALRRASKLDRHDTAWGSAWK